MAEVEKIGRGTLEQKMAEAIPDNVTREEGYALVNVLDPKAFAEEHIPNSINIPVNELDRFEDHFSKDKEIIVYCASAKCDASPKAAQALQERGFRKVYDYEKGLSDWKSGGNEVAGSPAT